jgi:hypothetical protein
MKSVDDIRSRIAELEETESSCESNAGQIEALYWVIEGEDE